MSLYGYSAPASPTITMKQFERKCDAYEKNPYDCISCTQQCLNGKNIVKQLEKETRKPMSKRQLGAADQRLTAMRNYLEAMSHPDPVKFLMEKYECRNVRIAKNKLYQWQHNYGTNTVDVAERIKEIEDEIAASKVQEKKESTATQKPKSAPISTEKPEVIPEEKKMTRRQEEKISQSHLSVMRSDLEKEYIDTEAKIEEYKTGIINCEKRMEEIAKQIQAIRQVLEIFNEKDKLYV